MDFKFGVIGSGSWATALVKILTDNGHNVNWWVRKPDMIRYIQKRKHNPHYLSSAYFDISLLTMHDNINEVLANVDVMVLAVPSAYMEEVFAGVDKSLLQNIKILSAIKGLVPGPDVLVNEYLQQH